MIGCQKLQEELSGNDKSTAVSANIDDDAAQLGWFVDSTPLDLSETGFSGVDLVSVIAHEQGHVLGLEDIYEAESDDVMDGTFEEGERRVIDEGRADGC